VRVSVYDPNRGPRDDIAITFDTAAPSRRTEFVHNLAVGRAVRGFFRTAYNRADPPGPRTAALERTASA
jgi:hypothetical protein